MAVLSEELRARADELIKRYPDPRSALLPLLYLVQSQEGHLTREGMQECGQILGLTTAEVEGVATFYTMFKRGPTGKWLVSVCTNVSCALLGAREVHAAARQAIGEAADTVTEDGLFTLEEVECLGACDAAPVVQVNYCSYDTVTPERMRDLVEALRAGDVPAPARGAKPVEHAGTARILSCLGDDRDA